MTLDRWGSKPRRAPKSTFRISRSIPSPGFRPAISSSEPPEIPRISRAPSSTIIHEVDPELAISNVRTLDEILDEDVAARRVGTTLLLAFAAFALLLAVVGIYGVIAYFVAQHVPEIGVRIALGAQTRDILLFVVGKGMRLALAGVVIGTIAALAATRLMTHLLYDVSGSSLVTCAIAGAGLVLLALVASYIPARRATGLDPIVALRAE